MLWCLIMIYLLTTNWMGIQHFNHFTSLLFLPFRISVICDCWEQRTTWGFLFWIPFLTSLILPLWLIALVYLHNKKEANCPRSLHSGYTELPTVPNIGQCATPLGRFHLPPIHGDAPPPEFCSWDF